METEALKSLKQTQQNNLIMMRENLPKNPSLNEFRLQSYKCDRCDSGYSRRVDLKAHIHKCHGADCQRLFRPRCYNLITCGHCDFKTCSMKVLKRHKSDVHASDEYGKQQSNVKVEFRILKRGRETVETKHEGSSGVHLDTDVKPAVTEEIPLDQSGTLECEKRDVDFGDDWSMEYHYKEYFKETSELEDELGFELKTAMTTYLETNLWRIVLAPLFVLMFLVSVLTCNWPCMIPLLILSDRLLYGLLTDSLPTNQSGAILPCSNNTAPSLVDYCGHFRRNKSRILSLVFEKINTIFFLKTNWTWSLLLKEDSEFNPAKVNPMNQGGGSGGTICPDLRDWQPCGKDYPLLSVEDPFSS